MAISENDYRPFVEHWVSRTSELYTLITQLEDWEHLNIGWTTSVEVSDIFQITAFQQVLQGLSKYFKWTSSNIPTENNRITRKRFVITRINRETTQVYWQALIAGLSAESTTSVPS